MKSSEVSNSIIRIGLVTFCLTTSTISYAYDEGGFGLSEEQTNLARKTLSNVRKIIDEAVRRVEKVIYPNIGTYGINTNVSVASSGIVADLIGGTGSTSGMGSDYTAHSVSSTYTSYKENPYISRMAVIAAGLRIQLKFVDASTSITSSTISAKIPIFEPLYARRIILIPIFNIKYDSSGYVEARDLEISSWECLSDADETMGVAEMGLSEGMRSVVSLGGGVLGTCQYVTVSNMDNIWSSI